MSRMSGQSINSLARPWSKTFEKYDEEMQEIESRRHNNDNILENGINRKVISNKSPHIASKLNKIATKQPFTHNFVKEWFCELRVAFIGDSLCRALYKDLVKLVHENNDELTRDNMIKGRLEDSWFGDNLVEYSDPSDKAAFYENREYLTNSYWIEYFFVTRIYNDKMEQILSKFKKDKIKPDVVVIHSNLWDASRYYTDDRISLAQYCLRLGKLCQRLREILPPTALVIFLLMPPAASEQSTSRAIKRGFFSFFIEARMEMMDKVTPFTQLKINESTAQIAFSYGFDVLDFNYHFQQESLAPLRAHDGLHFVSLGVRLQIQMLIGHMLKAFDVDLNSFSNLLSSHNDPAFRLQNLQSNLIDNRNQIAEDTITSPVYLKLLEMNRRIYEELKKDGVDIATRLSEAKAELLRDMPGCVEDPVLKFWSEQIQGIVENSIDNAVPTTSSEETFNDLAVPAFKEILAPNYEAAIEELTSEEKEAFEALDLSEILWSELWCSYVVLVAQLFGLRESEDDDLTGEDQSNSD